MCAATGPSGPRDRTNSLLITHFIVNSFLPCSGTTRSKDYVGRASCERGVQASSGAELAEQINHRGVGHRGTDTPAPPVHENVVVSRLLVFVCKVIRVQFHQFFRDMHSVRRSCFGKGAVAVRSRHDLDFPIVGTDVARTIDLREWHRWTPELSGQS